MTELTVTPSFVFIHIKIFEELLQISLIENSSKANDILS